VWTAYNTKGAISYSEFRRLSMLDRRILHEEINAHVERLNEAMKES
jgi:hypothetical protein